MPPLKRGIKNLCDTSDKNVTRVLTLENTCVTFEIDFFNLSKLFSQLYDFVSFVHLARYYSGGCAYKVLPCFTLFLVLFLDPIMWSCVANVTRVVRKTRDITRVTKKWYQKYVTSL